MDKESWYSKTYNIPLLKTQQTTFVIENEQFAKIYCLTGNDLETSETLYSVLFCINQKNTFPKRKDSIIF